MEAGICMGCRTFDEKKNFPWDIRKNELRATLTSPSNSRASGFDCVVPVIGLRDTFWVLDYLVNQLGLNPLLALYNSHFFTEVGWRNITLLRDAFNLDMEVLTLNESSVKEITRATLQNFGSMYWHVIAGNTSWPVRLAVEYGIPCIVWGEHQGIEQTGMFSYEHPVEMSRQYRIDNDLFTTAERRVARALHRKFHPDLNRLSYPAISDIHRLNIKGIYLSNYMLWDSRKQNEAMIKKYGAYSLKQRHTFNPYNDIHCSFYGGIHNQLKIRKVGYGKVVDDVAKELRFGRLTIGEARDLIKSYMSRNLKDIQKDITNFSEWIDLSPDSLEYLLNKSSNPNHWKSNYFGESRYCGLYSEFLSGPSNHSPSKYLKSFVFNSGKRSVKPVKFSRGLH